MTKLLRIRLALGLAILLVVLLGVPAAHSLVTRFFRAEPWYEGRTVSSWRKDLKHPDADVRRAAAKSLGMIGADAKDAVPALAKALTDEDALVRVSAAFALYKIGPDAREAAPALADALSDQMPLVRMDAAMALCRIGPDAEAAVPALTDALKAGDNRQRIGAFGASIRQEVVRALGNIGPASASAVPDLCAVLGDDDPGVCFASVRALGRIGPAAGKAVPFLRPMLGDRRTLDYHTLGTLAAESLQKIDPSAVARADPS